MASDMAKAFADTGKGAFNMQDYDNAVRGWYKVVPAPTLRAIIDRTFGGIGLTYKKDYNIFTEGLKEQTIIPFNQFSKGGMVRKNFSTGGF